MSAVIGSIITSIAYQTSQRCAAGATGTSSASATELTTRPLALLLLLHGQPPEYSILIHATMALVGPVEGLENARENAAMLEKLPSDIMV